MTWNMVYAVFNGALGLIYSSYWYMTLCAFYAALGFMRLSVVTIGRRRNRTTASVMKHNGIAMIGLAIVICGITVLTIRQKQNPVRNKMVMITIAACTFLLAAWSVRNIVKANRTKSPALITLRNISCAGTVGSVLSLERSMLGTFGDASEPFVKVMEASSGGVAFLLMIGLGTGMILYSKNNSRQNTSG